MVWPVYKPPSGIPAGGMGLHGDARAPGMKDDKAPFSATNQPHADLKSAGHSVRAEFRRVLAAKREAMEAVYDRALADEDVRVGLMAAKQISVELWGQPTQEISGPDGGAIPTSLTIAFIKPNAEPAD